MEQKQIYQFVRIVNQLRAERGLQRLNRPRTVTRETVRAIAREVWAKYPGALTSPDFELGSFTLDLVEKEINQRVNDLRRGVKVVRGFIPDNHFL